jgi:hypothetical protein
METVLVFLVQDYNPLANGVVLVMGAELLPLIFQVVVVVQVQPVVLLQLPAVLAKSMISAESLLIMPEAVAQSILQVVQVEVVVVVIMEVVSTALQIPGAVVQVACTVPLAELAVPASLSFVVQIHTQQQQQMQQLPLQVDTEYTPGPLAAL